MNRRFHSLKFGVLTSPPTFCALKSSKNLEFLLKKLKRPTKILRNGLSGYLCFRQGGTRKKSENYMALIRVVFCSSFSVSMVFFEVKKF